MGRAKKHKTARRIARKVARDSLLEKYRDRPPLWRRLLAFVWKKPLNDWCAADEKRHQDARREALKRTAKSAVRFL